MLRAQFIVCPASPRTVADSKDMDRCPLGLEHEREAPGEPQETSSSLSRLTQSKTVFHRHKNKMGTPQTYFT